MNNAEIKTLSFEDALQELQTIVQSLEQGETPLEESIAAYERGIALKNIAKKSCKKPNQR